jgi:hypothetical protein
VLPGPGRWELRAGHGAAAQRGAGRELAEGIWTASIDRVVPARPFRMRARGGFQVAAETRAFLAAQGVDLSGEQQTKTKTALKYFSQNLTAAATS